MTRTIALLVLLALAACASGGGNGTSGPYVGGSVGGNLRDDARSR